MSGPPRPPVGPGPGSGPGSDAEFAAGFDAGFDPDDRRARAWAEASEATWSAGSGSPATRTRSSGGHRPRPRRRRAARRVGVLAVLAVVVVPIVLLAVWFYLQVDPAGAPGPEVAVTIGPDWGTGEVASALADADVIGSTSAFRVWATFSGASPYTAGTYTMRTDLGARAAVNTLKIGPPPPPAVDTDVTLLLPPGLTLEQIADRVAQLPGRDRNTFLNVVRSGTVRSKYMPPEVLSAEGFLFPDTYRIGQAEREVDIAKKLVARFDQIADKIGLLGSPAINGLTPYQTVVAASLIQTEAKLVDEGPLISGVIRNRLRDRMPLQIDSTLCFAKGGCPPVPTNADKAIDSPYNTYRISGLPPGPISSVTEASLTSALRPADVPFKYYVLIDPSGRHKFATTLNEHNANVAEARAKGLL
jgi:UPF0755 protein